MWSNLVKAEKFYLGMLLAVSARMRQLVLAGLATTRDLTVFLATVSKEVPYFLKMPPLMVSKSFLSIPGFLGKPPMKTATSRSLNKTLSSEPVWTLLRRG